MEKRFCERHKVLSRALAYVLTIMLAITMCPLTGMGAAYAATDEADTRVADNVTIDGWKQFFGVSNDEFDTSNAGLVWTDKSVTTDASNFNYASELADAGDKITLNGEEKDSFLVSLSAMASSKSVTGQDNKPIHTMIVLDLSSSMYNNTEAIPDAVEKMFDSVNATIKKLQELNVNNKVGVTIYYGGPDLLQATANSYKVLLPLDRYVHSSDTYLVATRTDDGKNLSRVGVNTEVTTESGNSVEATSRTVWHKSGDKYEGVIAGTYIQQGLLSALDEFLDAETVVPDTAPVNAGESITPVMILMSDGKPTAATNEYTNLNKPAIMGSNAEAIRSAEETDFLTQLTAAYTKAMMDKHYKAESPLFYTLGLATEKDNFKISYDVMDPMDTLGLSSKDDSDSAIIDTYWNSLMTSNSFNMSYEVAKGQWNSELVTKNCTVSKTTVDGKSFPFSLEDRDYVDKVFTAAEADDLSSVFDNIFIDISMQTHTYPTLVDGNEDLDGYVSFVDKIGEYMGVTEIKGIILDDIWYSGKELSKNFVTGGGSLGTFDAPTALGNELVWSIQQRLGLSDAEIVRTLLGSAYQWGQLSYDDSTGEYNNYVGWYSNSADEYRGFWQEGVTSTPEDAAYENKSYIFLGQTDDEHGVSESDMMYITVRVRTHIETGEESVSFAVPAALIPTVEYDVELDENDKLTSVTKNGAEKPIRLVYEVKLDEKINEFTLLDEVDADYIEANENADGTVNFYTNQYEADGSVGYGKVNTYSYFRPAHQNENYYYQENEQIYENQNGTVYNSAAAPDPNGEYYIKTVVYSSNNGTISSEDVYIKLSKDALGSAEAKGDGSWYIEKGNVRDNAAGYTVEKEENFTGTLVNVNKPYVDTYGNNINDTNHRFVIGDTLGNNGKVKLGQTTAIKITKKVDGTTTETTETDFEFEITGPQELTGEYDTVKIAADGTKTEGSVNFKEGKATVSIKAKESVYIKGIAPNVDFTVTEIESAGFVLSEVVVNEKAIEGATAQVTTVAQDVSEIEFTNTPRGKGSLTIAKAVDHPLGSEYQIPSDKEFKVNVKLEGAAINAGDTFEIIRTGSNSAETVKLEGFLRAEKEFDVSLKAGETVKILNIPEGTAVTVTEPQPGPGFTVSYKENNVAGDGKIVLKKESTVNNVTVVNKYEPGEVKVKINLSGTKTLLDKEGKEIPKEDWDEDLQFKFIVQKYVYEDGKWQWVNTETIDTADKTDNKVDFLTEGKELTFSEVGTYGYQVIEENHGKTIDGITYDGTMHTFNVVVTDEDMDGQLEAEVVSSHGTDNGFVLKDGVWTNDEIDFVNRNNQGHTSETIMIKKALDNESGSSAVSLAGYEFELYETDEDYEIVGDKIKTTAPTDTAGETYVQLSYDYTHAGEYSYYYKLKEKVPDPVKKGMTYSAKEYNFKVTVSAGNNGEMASTVVEGKDTQFGEFASAAAGITYDLATFTNKYDPTDAKVEFDVNKTLENRTLKEGEFTFQITADLADAPMPESAEVRNAADGNVNFGEIVFDRVGTYEYTIKEVPGEDEKIVYDDTVYDVVVKVVDNNGSLEAAVDVLTIPETEMVFNNEYIPESTEVGFDGEKDLKGKTLVGGQFAFTLAECDKDGTIKTDGYQQTVTNNNKGSFEFDDVSYNNEGTYYYVIYEEVPESTYGIEYDETKYIIKVDVDYDADKGEYVATKTTSELENSTESEVEFINKYEPAATTANIRGNKSLEGWELKDKQFEFNLYKSDASWQKGDKLHSVENAENGSFGFEFESDYFDEAGTYYYIIDETQGGEEGYTYDEKKVGVIIDVTDDMVGALHANLSYVDIEETEGTVSETPAVGVSFNNEYEAGPTELALKVSKEITGREWFDTDEFKFVVEAIEEETLEAITANKVEISDDAAVATKTNKEAVFEPITFNEVGTYKFRITEVSGDDENISYDNHVVEAIVTVTDDGSGKLTAAVAYSGETTFTNVFTPDEISVVLQGEKIIEGRDLKENEFAFNIEALTENTPMPAITQVTNNDLGEIEFGAIEYDEAGSYEYVITETPSGLPGVTDDQESIYVTVTVEYDPNKGLLSADVDYDKNGENEFVFENSYKAAPVEIAINALKKVEVSEGNSFAMQGEDFKFEIEPAETNPTSDPIKKQSLYNNSDGEINIEAEYTEAGKYVYTLREVSVEKAGMLFDSSVYRIEVTVTDDTVTGKLLADTVITKDGREVDSIVFDNKYDPEKTSVQIHGYKQLEGKALESGEFTFEIEAVTEDAPMPGETKVTNTDTGVFQFDTITYDKVGIYKYEVKEIDEGKTGYSYDDSVYAVTVTVTDDNGKLKAETEGIYTDEDETAIVFNNSYDPEDIAIEIGQNKELVKNLDGREITEGEFEFELLDGDNVIATAKNDEDGYFGFELKFTHAGTYNYSIVEKNTNVAGVTYDTSIYGAVFEVVDEGGKLKIENIDYVKDDNKVEAVVFNNTYTPSPTEVEFSALKIMKGRDLADNEFSFVLEDANGETAQIVKNDADGFVSFGAIEYEEPGTYKYKIYEEKGDLEDVAYDDSVYEITVEVTDNLNGNLEAEVLGDEVVPTFVNTYEPEGNGTKTGDDFDLLPIAAMMQLALIGIVATLLRRRKAE